MPPPSYSPPELARKWLDTVGPGTWHGGCATYVETILAGNWHDGSVIRFRDGRMTDGCHRCRAVIQADRAIVVVTIDDSCQTQSIRFDSLLRDVK